LFEALAPKLYFGERITLSAICNHLVVFKIP